MIKKLRTRFIILSMVSLFVLMLSVVVGMNLLNYLGFVRDSDELISLISDNRGSFPEFEGSYHDKLPPSFSPETPHQTRYFSVLVSDDGNIIEINTQEITSVNRTTAATYAAEAIAKGKSRGFVDRFRYAVVSENNGVRISFIDRGRELDAVIDFALISIVMSTLGYIIISIFVILISNKIISPIAESYKKQKRFITDAGHEMKTPLTIIAANADLCEMELGECEQISEIRNQCIQLGALTKNLVYLAKMEETDNSAEMIELPLSEIVRECASAFEAPAKLMGKRVVYRIEPMISTAANDEAVRRLVSVLVDNAVKYSPENTEVVIGLQTVGRQVLLEVENECAARLTKEDTERLFDRFYRPDASRTSSKGGSGIGLSIAAAIAEAHGGRISAAVNENKLKITVRIPRKGEK